MTAPTNTFQTYQAVGNREDLIDVITNISPVDTWVTANTPNGIADAVLHEWQTDSLAAPTANAVIEGDSTTAGAVSPTTRVTNYCQILKKAWQVSGTQEAVKKAGRSSEIDYQKLKAMKELARDIEYALIVNTAAASGASATARQMKGIAGWIATNVTTGTGTGNEALTETMLNDNLQLIWAQGGMPSTILAGAFQKRTISGFTTNTREVSAEAEKLVRTVSVYQSDFGDMQVRLHQQMHATYSKRLIILGDMSLWVKAWLRPVVDEELAKTSDSRLFQAIAELTLESRQEKGSGQILELLDA